MNTNGAYLGNELRALINTLGLTDLGRAFMARHTEIFGEATSAMERRPSPPIEALNKTLKETE